MRSRTVQSSFLSGVLDPRTAGRVKTDAYNQGLLKGVNVLINHLGGVRRRPGLEHIQTLPNQLDFLTPATATAPNGGTAANGFDDDDSTTVETTTGATTATPHVVLHYDMGTPVEVTHADVRRIQLSGSSSSKNEFRIQRSIDNSNWTDFGDPFPLVDSTARTFRRNQFSDLVGTFSTEARYWRLVRIGDTDLGSDTVEVSEFNLWADSGTVSNVRLVSFEKSANTRYLVALTDRSATVVANGAVITPGSMPMPYSSSDIPDVDAATGDRTLYLVHEDHPPRFVLDEFDGEDFQTDTVVFENVPQFDFNDSNSPSPDSEIQVITFDSNWFQGDTFQIELDGARTGLISFAGDQTTAEQLTTAANIAREVQKLYTVPGFTGVTCARTGSLEYTVTFADASAKSYEGLMGVSIAITSSSDTPTATVERTQAGVARSEDVWSDTRGYPRTVTFFEGRLYFGGTRSKQQSLFGSAVDNITNFEILEALPADAIFVTLRGQQLNAINGLYSGRSLEIFTSGGEFRYLKQQGEPITPSDAPAAQTQYGAKRVGPVNVDGSTIFVQRAGKTIRDYKFDFNENAYNSLGVSSLAPHLFNNVVDLAAWQGSSTDEMSLVFVVNSDGTVAVLNIRREAEVRAWSHWATGKNVSIDSDDGSISGQEEFKAAAATVEEVYFAVKRNIDNKDVLFLELMNSDFYVDAGVNTAGGEFAGAAHLANEECRVRLQDKHIVLSNETPDSNGTVTPSETEFEDASIQVGLNFNPVGTPMPLNAMTPIGDNNMVKRRVKKVRAKVHKTLGLRVNGRPLPDRYADINNFDLDPDPFTGNHTIEETSNWDEQEDKIVEFDQVDPLPMEILALTVDMESA